MSFEDEGHLGDSDDEMRHGPSGAVGRGVIEDGNEVLDRSAGNKKIWLVKVPKFLIERWSAVQGDGVELGRLRVYQNKQPDGADRIAVLLPPDIAQGAPGQQPVPAEYTMTIQNKATKNMYVFSERSDVGLGESGWQVGQGRQKDPATGPARPAKQRKPTLTGMVHHECNLTPRLDSESYRSIMKARIAKAAEPKRRVQMLENDTAYANRLAAGAATGHKSVNKFQTFVKAKDKVAAGQKMVRIPRNELLDMLFQAFEQYEYWTIKNLRAHTQQPEAYLKEVLADIGTLQKRGPYAGTWCLQPAYKAARQPAASGSGTAKKEEEEEAPAQSSDEEMEEVVG